jgi:hypothetical protein
MTTELSVIDAARAELQLILDAGARGLKQRGIELMPIKPEMLQLENAQAALVLDACNLCFAACLSYEDATWTMDRATNPIELVSARIEQARAIGVIESLFHGPTRGLLWLAMDRASIAFYAMAQSSPALRIVDRVNGASIPHIKKA